MKRLTSLTQNQGIYIKQKLGIDYFITPCIENYIHFLINHLFLILILAG